ncbi:hypothetical protein HNP48_006846 [Acidovorax soli]|uniref:Large polyvalent protein associated domain-containing protein n=1 Tax=Acidovorax soli TaxID=592050 RepID=A0A7X0UDW9_9BURK|nr:hypothetical protein [Acidovorax soli]MBB6564120.1 hypothetical protein [Acidovorax soli]
MEMQRDGTLMVKGDPVQLQERLRQGGVERVLRREGGVLVGLDQVGKARQLLQQQPPRAPASAGATLPSQPSSPALSGQQFSRSAPPSPDRPSRARDLPSKPATVQSVRAAVAKLTNSMGLLAEGRGRVLVATSADIQAHWQPLVGKVDMGSQDTGLAQGFFDPNTNTVFLIADHIEAGQEMAVAVHELVHKHGKAVLGEAGWRQLHEVIGSWANKPEGSLERQVYDEAAARVQASRPDNADAAAYSSEELFPYAVQVAMELGVQPTALMPNNSVQGWLARVRASLKDVLGKLTGNPQAFDGQDLVDLAFAVVQRENPAYRAQSEARAVEEISHERNDLQFSRRASRAADGNYVPPPIEDIVPAEILASARETIERLMPLAVETANSDPQALAQAALELQPYLERAEQAKPVFDQAVRDVANKAGALGVQLAPVKGIKRASEKMVLDGVPADGIKDLLRATVVVPTYGDAQAVIHAMEQNFTLVKIKNRTEEAVASGLGVPVEQTGVLRSGYADVLVLLEFLGMPAEVQINVPAMLSVKAGEAHTLYEIERVLPEGSPTRSEASTQARKLQDVARAATSKPTATE